MKIYKAVFLIITGFIFFAASPAVQYRSVDDKGVREVAFTFDDLPAVAPAANIELQRQITAKLLKLLSENNISAAGFVNEGKLFDSGVVNPAKVDLLKEWLDRGHELGNHTYSHFSLNNIKLEIYKEDMVKGEKITKELLSRKGMKIRYFRHPFLHTGRTPEVKHGFESFLDSLGYTAAPVTIDNSDWIFAKAYSNALEKGDTSMLRKIAGEYIPYMERKFEYYESQSVKIFGREIKQVLLLHANTINADYLGALASMLRARGYKFTTLENVLKDPAYSSEDNFMRAGGISWLHRWAITKNLPKEMFRGEPVTPGFICHYAGVEAE